MDREEFVLVRDMVRSLATRFGVTSADEVKPSTQATAQQALDELGLTDLRRTSPPAATAQECALLAEEHGRHPLTTSLLGRVLLAPELLRLLGTDAPGTTPTIALTRELRFPGETLTDLAAWDCEGADSALCVTDDGTVTRVELGPSAPSTDLVRSVRTVPPDGPTEVVGHLTAPDQLRWQAYALVVVTAELVGAANSLVEQSAEYARVRHQYGRPIGSFQAVQHKAADMHVAVERARALAYFAALTIAADDPRRRLAAVMAKASAGECQSLVFRHGLQLFGAMGFTWENDLQFALKRAKVGELLLGGAAEHRAMITEEYRAAHL